MFFVKRYKFHVKGPSLTHFLQHSSSSKFDSGTGWPSFHSALEMPSNGNLSPQPSVTEKSDNSYGMIRVEVLCHQVIYFS